MTQPRGDAGTDLAGALARLRQSFERFGPIPDAVWDELQRPWRLRTLRRGDHLTREGETEQTFALIVEGVQRLYFTGPDGDEHTIAFAYAPDYTGVPDSFFLQTPSAYALEALTDGVLIATDHARFMPLLERHREVERWALGLFARAMAGRMKREREHLTLTARERYERLLRESPHVVQIAPLRHVASYLGMAPETLSRARAGS